MSSVNDNESLREKVDEAVKVFNEYVQKQGSQSQEGENGTNSPEQNVDGAQES